MVAPIEGGEMSKPRYATNPDKNHRVPIEYLRDRCGGFEDNKIGSIVVYSANFRGYRMMLFDTHNIAGAFSDFLLQCADNNRMMWLECKTPEAYKKPKHDMTTGEEWLFANVTNMRFIVEDADMEGVLMELIF